MEQEDRFGLQGDLEVRGPAPSVSTPLLFLVMLTVVTAFSGLSVLASPSENALKPYLNVLVFVPSLFAWWLWARDRQHPHLLFVVLLTFLAGQFISGLTQLLLLADAPRTSLVLNWLTVITTGLLLGGGLIFLWFKMRRTVK